MVGAVLPSDWYDDNPFFIVISTDAGEHVILDLGEPGWMAKHEGLMREPAKWAMFDKHTATPILRINVLDGEQPYYVARHMGVAGSGGSNEITVYGIGKKRLDGHVDRLWALPDGSVTVGDDIDVIGIAWIHMVGPRYMR